MNTATTTEIRRAITAALGDRAKLLRNDAANRKWTGPAFADFRARIRDEAKLCEDLQRIVAHVDPEKLAAALKA